MQYGVYILERTIVETPEGPEVRDWRSLWSGPHTYERAVEIGYEAESAFRGRVRIREYERDSR